ncbi:Leucine-rich repeat serine/threonine-protein kinase 2 [Rhizophlyctis rosea]|nr:Leucine-rich repeat serine/threonine-protein kinase 2 [Rhizophlyctis rosea]
MATTSIDALSAQIDKLLIKANALEEEVIDAADEATATALDSRLQRCYGIINQKTAILQSLRAAQGPSTPVGGPSPATPSAPIITPAPLPTPTATPPPYTPLAATDEEQDLGDWSIFISYCWENSAEAAELGQVQNDLQCGPCDPRKLARELSYVGFNTWLDVDRLGDGQPLYEELVRGITPSKCAIACVSDAYIRSKNCNREFMYIHSRKIPVIVIVVGKERCHWTQSSIGFVAGDTVYIDTVAKSFAEILTRVKQAVRPFVNGLVELSPADARIRAAESGDADAQYDLALSLYNDEGEGDRDAAIVWFRQAAEQGHAEAQLRMGRYIGDETAGEWYLKAAEQGLVEAMEGSAKHCIRRKKYTEAQKWYKKQGEMGDAEIAMEIGKGALQQKDQLTAAEWYRQAAEKGDAEVLREVGHHYRDWAEDYREAARWYQRAVACGLSSAQIELGDLYGVYSGMHNVCREDYAEAAKWYLRAAEQGDVDGQCRIASLYVLGRGVLKDSAQSVKWYRKAAEQGSRDAQFQLGMAYRYGWEGQPPNRAEAKKWYKLAAAQGCSTSAESLLELQ